MELVQLRRGDTGILKLDMRLAPMMDLVLEEMQQQIRHALRNLPARALCLPCLAKPIRR